MDKEYFEGSLVLEKLAQIHKLDEFYDAIDSDDFSAARSLMLEAGLSLPAIEIVLNKMKHSEE